MDIIDNKITYSPYSPYSPYYVARTSANGSEVLLSRDKDGNLFKSINLDLFLLKHNLFILFVKLLVFV